MPQQTDDIQEFGPLGPITQQVHREPEVAIYLGSTEYRFTSRFGHREEVIDGYPPIQAALMIGFLRGVADQIEQVIRKGAAAQLHR